MNLKYANDPQIIVQAGGDFIIPPTRMPSISYPGVWYEFYEGAGAPGMIYYKVIDKREETEQEAFRYLLGENYRKLLLGSFKTLIGKNNEKKKRKHS